MMVVELQAKIPTHRWLLRLLIIAMRVGALSGGRAERCYFFALQSGARYRIGDGSWRKMFGR